MGKVYILVTILLTAYGQLALKWRLDQMGHLPEGLTNKAEYLSRVLIDPIVLSTFLAAFVASLTWIGLISRSSLSIAYPLLSINYLIVCLMSVKLFKESLTGSQVIGSVLIVFGAALLSKR